MSRTVFSSGAQALNDFPVPQRPQSGTGPKPGSGAVRAAPAKLSAKAIGTWMKQREGRWRPSLADQPLHSEIFASASDASGAGVALALACDALAVSAQQIDPTAQSDDRRQVLWVQDQHAIQRSGRPYRHGLPAELRDRLIHVEAKTPEDALFALEEGLRCRDLVCVIGELTGNPRALDFTASRRLSLAAEKHGVPLWLVRLEAEADLSSARMRWRVKASPSPPPRWNMTAPGEPAWEAELFRARNHLPGKWVLSNEDGRLSARRASAPFDMGAAANTQEAGAPYSGDLVRPTVGRSLAAFARG